MAFESIPSSIVPEASKKTADTPDFSRRRFLSFGMKDGDLKKNVVAEKLGVAEPDAAVVSVDEEHPEKITRREVLKALTAGAVVGSLVVRAVDKGVTGTLSAINAAGGMEEIGKKAKRIKDGVTDGRLAKYVAERQEDNVNKEELEARLSQLKKQFEKTYRISLVFGDNPHFHRADRDEHFSSEANLRSKIESVDWLISELQRYPDFMIDELHIPSITIRNTLKNDSNGEVGGFAERDDHSIAINLQDDIWRVLQFGKPSPYDTVSHIIHHELFHLLDPLCNEGTTESSLVEQQWQNINQTKNLAYSGNTKLDDAARPLGFAKSYGMKNILEDRATIFEELMTAGLSPEIIKDDPVLGDKVNAIMREIFVRSRGAIGKGFFGRYVSLGKRIDWAEKIVKNDRQAMIKEESLFEEVSDETYRDWQQFHKERTIPDYHRKQKELAA